MGVMLSRGTGTPPESGQEAVLEPTRRRRGFPCASRLRLVKSEYPHPLYSANKLGHSEVESLVELLKCFLAEAK